MSSTGYWSDDPKCVHMYFEKDGNYILSMCPLHPEKIWGVNDRDCEECEYRQMDGGGTNERKLISDVDEVSRAAYEQVVWERDTAIHQLESIGKHFGEKMDDVAKIVRCLECENWDTDWTPEWSKDGVHYCPMADGFRSGNWFCADGKRRGNESR